MKNILVVFGGESVEHEVSIITGVMTVNSVDKEKYNAIPVYVDRSGKWYSGEYLLDVDNYKSIDYKKIYSVALFSGDNAIYKVKGKKLKSICKISAVINCMHGERGEDGSLAGLLKLCNIPLISPGLIPSAVFMDKQQTKLALKSINIKTLDGVTVSSVREGKTALSKLGLPLIIKPCNGGSSIGVIKVEKESDLQNAVLFALKFDKRVIIERALDDFVEINCACYKASDERICVSECEKPIGRKEFLTFDDKYNDGKREFPAKIDKKFKDKIQGITKKIYGAFNFTGVIRIDFFITEKTIYVNEVNTVPGSLAYYLFCNTLKEFKHLLSEMIEVCLISYAKDSNVIREYRSGILTSMGSKGAKTVEKNR